MLSMLLAHVSVRYCCQEKQNKNTISPFNILLDAKYRITSLMHRGTHCYTHLNLPPDLDQLSGQVVKTSALESSSRGFESRPSSL